MVDKKNATAIIAGIIFLYSIHYISYHITQSSFYQYFVCYSLFFLSYLTFIKLKIFNNYKSLIFMLICLISILPSFPSLSDDIYRYYWDGNLIGLGINPYKYTPTQMLALQIDSFDYSVYEHLNSQNYFSVYPTVSQIYFFIASSFSNDVEEFGVILRALYILTLVIIWLVLFKSKYYNKWKYPLTLFFLNPLVVIEGIGNLHTEFLACCFIILFFLFVSLSKLYQAIAALVSAILVKLNPGIFVIFFLANFKKYHKQIIYILSFVVIGMLPIFLGIKPANFLSSIDLYFRRFEFNASIYYLLRWVGMLLSGYNLIAFIGPLLGLIGIILIARTAINYKDQGITGILLFGYYSFFIYLLISTTVHPWYIMILLLLGLMLNKKTPIIWSFLIGLTYINYSNMEYFENLWFVAFEYVVVLSLFLLEEKRSLNLITH